MRSSPRAAALQVLQVGVGALKALHDEGEEEGALGR
jgi:hypothetical protein